MTKECNCCYKNTRTISKCFVNNQCSWRSCNNCINRQIKMTNDMQYEYVCPQCKKTSNYHKHSRFSKYIKQNRAALLKIVQLQNEYIKSLNNKLTKVHLIVASVGLEPDIPFHPIQTYPTFIDLHNGAMEEITLNDNVVAHL